MPRTAANNSTEPKPTGGYLHIWMVRDLPNGRWRPHPTVAPASDVDDRHDGVHILHECVRRANNASRRKVKHAVFRVPLASLEEAAQRAQRSTRTTEDACRA